MIDPDYEVALQKKYPDLPLVPGSYLPAGQCSDPKFLKKPTIEIRCACSTLRRIAVQDAFQVRRCLSCSATKKSAPRPPAQQKPTEIPQKKPGMAKKQKQPTSAVLKISKRDEAPPVIPGAATCPVCRYPFEIDDITVRMDRFVEGTKCEHICFTCNSVLAWWSADGERYDNLETIHLISHEDIVEQGWTSKLDQAHALHSMKCIARNAKNLGKKVVQHTGLSCPKE